jgi:hypothetical protein
MVGTFAQSPFTHEDAYRRWRNWKLAVQPTAPDDLIVEIGDPFNITESEYVVLLEHLRVANMAIYSCRRPSDDPAAAVRAVATRFDLDRVDARLGAEEGGITPLRVTVEDDRGRYIPFTDRPINWHTDGYYNAIDKQVRAFILYCARDAESGGENFFMDPEIAYIRLREANPDFIVALSHPTVMSIPANNEDGAEIRGEITGPVFSIDPRDASLGMRYTARTRSIAWRDDPLTRAAVSALAEIFKAPGKDVLRRRLLPGQGVIANNVLHGRTAFQDSEDSDKGRLVYRGRFYDRISDTTGDMT